MPIVKKVDPQNGYIDLHLLNIESECCYRICVTGGTQGITDQYRNYMMKDYIIFLNT